MRCFSNDDMRFKREVKSTTMGGSSEESAATDQTADKKKFAFTYTPEELEARVEEIKDEKEV